MKRGIATILATFVLAMVAMSVVSLILVGISPVVSINFKSFNAQISIIKSEGYTYYDSENKELSVHVGLFGSDKVEAVEFLFIMEDGSTIVSYYEAPLLNTKKRYNFDFSESSSTPKRVSISAVYLFEDDLRIGLPTGAVNIESLKNGQNESLVDHYNPFVSTVSIS